jgi:glycosyltransferase involved in cell wall biosynthesis
MQSIFIILPCYNEDEALPVFWVELKKEIDAFEAKATPPVEFHTVWVDDGSSDQTWKTIEGLRRHGGETVHGVRLARNFGHQSALQAGCEFVARHPAFSKNSIVILMDSDGQHPVNRIPEMVNALNSTSRHLQMVRTEPNQGHTFKKFTGDTFYRCFRFFTNIQMPEGAADFRAVKGDVLLNYLKYTESGRFNRGLFYLAEPPTFIEYVVNARKHGVSKYSLSKMLKLAFFGITNFSNRPLIFVSLGSTILGFTVCIVYLSFEFYRFLHGHEFQPGWFTVMAWISMWGMILSFCLLMISLYLGRIFDETKKRPTYLSREEF